MKGFSEEGAILLEGAAAVRGALHGESRSIVEILLSRKKKPNRFITWLTAEAGRRNLPLRTVEPEEIEKMGASGGHGGVVALVGKRSFTALNELLTADTEKPPLVVMLDGIEDPYNLGFAIRTLYAAGVSGVVLRERDWGSAEGTILRSSAGAFDLMPIACTPNAEEAARLFRSSGLTIAATDYGRGSRSLYKVDLTLPLFLLIGGERRGITRSFLDNADLIVHIPYGRDFRGSLTAASAAAVIGFEAMRQRNVE